MAWKRKLSRAKQKQNTRVKNKSDTVFGGHGRSFFQEPNCCVSHFCLPREKTMTNHQKTPRSVSAVLASPNLLLWVLTLPPLWHWCREKWWMIEAFLPPPPIFFHSSVWWQHYLFWQTLAVCGVSPSAEPEQCGCRVSPLWENKLGGKLNTSISICNNQSVLNEILMRRPWSSLRIKPSVRCMWRHNQLSSDKTYRALVDIVIPEI